MGTLIDECKFPTGDSVEDRTRIDVRLAIDKLILDMIVNNELYTTEEADRLRQTIYTPAGYVVCPAAERRLLHIHRRNKVQDVIDFFATDEKPIGHNEFFDFWESISIAERMFYLMVPLD